MVSGWNAGWSHESGPVFIDYAEDAGRTWRGVGSLPRAAVLHETSGTSTPSGPGLRVFSGPRVAGDASVGRRCLELLRHLFDRFFTTEEYN
jgi:hypothetical protein